MHYQTITFTITPQYPLVGFAWKLPIEEDIDFKLQLRDIPIHALEVKKKEYSDGSARYEVVGHLGGFLNNVYRIEEEPGFVCVQYTSLSEKYKWFLIREERKRRGWKEKKRT